MTKYKIKISKINFFVSVLTIWALSLFCHFDFATRILAFGPNSSALAVDKIIAIVNNEIITQKDLDDFSNFMRVQLSQELSGKELEEKIGKMKPEMLQKLIDDSLILQEAKKNNIKADPARVKGKLEETKTHYSSESKFESVLRSQGLVMADLEKRIRDQMLMYSIIEMKVRQNIKINPSEITEFYQNNTKDFILPELRNFQVLSSKDQDKANLIYASLKHGKDIEQVAKDNSLQINNISSYKNGELRKDIEEAIFKINIGEVCAPIKNEDTYYVFKLHSIEAPKQQDLGDAQERIYSYLYEKRMQEKLNQWIDELKKHSYIKII